MVVEAFAGWIRETRKQVLPIFPWVRKGGLAVLDQGLFSGANFLVNILLARWLVPEEYGTFAVALSIFYLLARFHTAVLTEPMMVFGSGKYRKQFRKYLGMLLYGHWGISLLIAFVLGATALVMHYLGAPSMAQALAGLAVASPFLLFLWLTRRACYVPMRPAWAVVGSGANLMVTLGGVFLFWRAGLLSSFSGLVLLGVAAGMASLLLTLPLRPYVTSFEGNPTVRMVTRDHWKYGQWLILNGVTYWFFSDAVFPFLSAFQDLHAAGVFRAYQNFFLPIFQFLTAVGLLILPVASRYYNDKNILALRGLAIKFSVLSVLSTTLYGIIIYILRRPIVILLLGREYIPYTTLLQVWLWGPAILAFGKGAEISLRASEKSQFVYLSYLMGAITALVSFSLLIPSFGLMGAVWARIASFSIQTIFAIFFAMRYIPNDLVDKGLS